jgi:hypothetical protein
VDVSTPQIDEIWALGCRTCLWDVGLASSAAVLAACRLRPRVMATLHVMSISDCLFYVDP